RMSLWQKFVHAITGCDMGGAEESEPKSEESHENAVPHDHSQGCPYQGGSSGGQYCPRPIPVEKPAEESKPAEGGKTDSLMRSFRDVREFLESRPAFPRTDTMEFRRSDRRLNEYGQTPDTL